MRVSSGSSSPLWIFLRAKVIVFWNRQINAETAGILRIFIPVCDLWTLSAMSLDLVLGC